MRLKFKIICLIVLGLIGLGVMTRLVDNPDLVLAQAICPNNNLADGLVSALGPINGLGNLQQICITGAPAYIPTAQATIRVDSYSELHKNYYEKSGLPNSQKVVLKDDSYGKDKTPGGANRKFPAINQNTLFLRPARSPDPITRDPGDPGNLTIKDDAFIDNPNSSIGVVFVDGDLNITSNIMYAKNNSQAGLVFIVKGQINIDQTDLPASRPESATPCAATATLPDCNTQEINAVLVAEGVNSSPLNPHSICSACESDPASPIYGQKKSLTIKSANVFDRRLVVYGNLVSLAMDKNIELYRVPRDTQVAAETINSPAKYLVTLRQMIAKSVKIWSEE